MRGFALAISLGVIVWILPSTAGAQAPTHRVYLPSLSRIPNDNCKNYLAQGDFESDDGWTWFQKSVRAARGGSVDPVSGNYFLALSPGNSAGTGVWSDSIYLPPIEHTSKIELSYWLRGTTGDSIRRSDWLHIKAWSIPRFSTNDIDAVIEDSIRLPSQWALQTYNLLPRVIETKMRAMELEIAVVTDYSGPTSWFVDAMQLTVCTRP